MENQKEFNEKLDEIRKDTLIEVTHSWGNKTPGYNGKIITNNKELYSYQYYRVIPQGLEYKKVNFISKIKELSLDEYHKVIKFIEDEIIDKEFYNKRILDSTFDVIVNYKGISKTIENNKGLSDDLQIYDKAQQLVDGLFKKGN